MKISLQPEEEKRSEVKWDATEKHKAEAEGGGEGRRAKGRRDRTDHETNERTTAATRTKKKSE